MSMFDKETQLKNAEFALNGQSFTLFSVGTPAMSSHAEYGNTMKATVKAGALNSPEADAKTYIVFGVMAEQCGRTTANDLPANVQITKDGRANVLQKVS